jgi:DNA polymerase III delta prime subunit
MRPIVRNYSALSPHDFELLVADLLSADTGRAFQAFGDGPDGGIDLRYRGASGLHIVQCKHYRDGQFASLRRAAAKEAVRLAGRQPLASYTFVTTHRLTVKQHDSLENALESIGAKELRILGAEALEGLLNRHEAVERAHVKLWLSSSAQLSRVTNAGLYHRSRRLWLETEKLLPRYVETGAFVRARARLREEGVLIITGPPGIGKTTLATMLVVDAAVDGHQAFEVSADIEEGNQVVGQPEPQVFLYDDFLGSTFLQDRLGKNEDKRLTAFMREIAASEGKLLVMTTREHILHQAVQFYEELERAGVTVRRHVLQLSDYSRLDRARIFCNHAWESGQLTQAARDDMEPEGVHGLILDHGNFSPRLVEHVTGLGQKKLGIAETSDYAKFVVGVFDRPEVIWRTAFERQLDDFQRAILVALASFPRPVTTGNLETAFRSYCAALGVVIRGPAFRDAVTVLDETWISVTRFGGERLVAPANPSVRDFVASWLAESTTEASAAVDGACYYQQLRWLYVQVLEEIPRNLRASLRELWLRAIERCYDAPALDQLSLSESGMTRVQTFSIDWAGRLVQALQMSNSYVGLRPLNGWVYDQLPQVIERWNAGYVNRPSAAALIGELRRRGHLPPEVLEAALASVCHKPAVIGDWRAIGELGVVAPKLWDDFPELVGSFREFASEVIANPEASLGDLEAIGDIASSSLNHDEVLGYLERARRGTDPSWLDEDPQLDEAFDFNEFERSEKTSSVAASKIRRLFRQLARQQK